MALRYGAGKRLLILALALLASYSAVTLVYNMQDLVGPSGTGGSGAPFPGLSPIPIDAATSITISLVLSVVGGGIILAAFLRYRPKGKGFPFEELLPVIVLLLVFLAILFLVNPLAQDTVEETGEEDGSGGQQPGDSTGGGSSSGPLVPSNVSLPSLGLLAAFLVLSAVTFLMSTLRHRRWASMADEEADELRRGEMVRSIQEGLYRLTLGDDVRSVILGCYRDMVSLFKDRGVKAEDYLTARELESLAIRRLRLSSESSKSLRELFEIARYSTHPLTEEDRRRAADCLERVRTELEA